MAAYRSGQRGKIDEERIVKEELAEAIRILAQGGVFTETFGHVSVRRADRKSMLILGHKHDHKGTLGETTAKDIIKIDFDGNILEGAMEPPGEYFIHSEVYRLREDVEAIVHAHPLVSMAFGVAGKPLIPVDQRAARFYPFVPVYDHAGQINSSQIGHEMAKSLGSNCALLLRGHGTVVVGGSLQDAIVSSFLLERNAQVVLWATALGGCKGLQSEDFSGTLVRGTTGNPAHVYAYYQKLAERK